MKKHDENLQIAKSFPEEDNGMVISQFYLNQRITNMINYVEKMIHGTSFQSR